MLNALLDAPKTAKRGETVTVKVLVAHPMETGYRRDITGTVIPRDIITSLACRYDGAEVFRADLFPAIAANPYVAFTLLATRTGPVALTWRGDGGVTHTESFTLLVTP